jgi:hypothetical protein
MFSIIITVIYIRCMLCATTESHLQTDISSTGIIDTTLVSIKYSTLETTPVVMVFCGSCCDVLVESDVDVVSNGLSVVNTRIVSVTSSEVFVGNSVVSILLVVRVQSRTTKTDKLHGMTLEEKQKRNGLASAIICVGSLILIVIAYIIYFCI